MSSPSPPADTPFHPEAPLLSPIHRRLGVSVEDLADGSVALSIVADPSFHNEVGLVHGGLAALLLDGAMGRAVGRTLEPGAICATLQLSVQYLHPAEGRLLATGRVVRRGRSTAFAEAACVREDGRQVATAHGVWTIRPAARA